MGKWCSGRYDKYNVAYTTSMSNLKKKTKDEKQGELNDSNDNNDNSEKENPTEIGPGITERYDDA